MPKNYIQRLRITPTMTNATVTVTAVTPGTAVTITVNDSDTIVGTFTGVAGQPIVVTPPPPAKLWQPLNAFLYTMQVRKQGRGFGGVLSTHSMSFCLWHRGVGVFVAAFDTTWCTMCSWAVYRKRQVTLESGDSVGSYFGLRSVSLVRTVCCLAYVVRILRFFGGCWSALARSSLYA